MITNDERRRIAAKLRACAGTEYIEVEELCEAIECRDGFRGADGEPAIWNRLTDLVEPDATSAMTKTQEFSLSAGLCNREALLKLAEDVRCYCIEGRIEPWIASRIYDRIREACGEVRP